MAYKEESINKYRNKINMKLPCICSINKIEIKSEADICLELQS
jgi:hypothetical protein